MGVARFLGSRNGTTLAGRRLRQGERAAVALGALVSFGGSSNRWRLIDDGPPVPMARPLDGGEPICAEHELIALPNTGAPEVTVYRDAAGEWMLERESGTERAVEGREVSAGGWRFTLHLPDVVAPTWEGEALPLSLERLSLRFTVSRDEEFIEVSAVAPGHTVELGARAHHGVLLALARARLEDQQEAARAPAASRLPETSQGWLYLAGAGAQPAPGRAAPQRGGVSLPPAVRQRGGGGGRGDHRAAQADASASPGRGPLRHRQRVTWRRRVRAHPARAVSCRR